MKVGDEIRFTKRYLRQFRREDQVFFKGTHKITRIDPVLGNTFVNYVISAPRSITSTREWRFRKQDCTVFGPKGKAICSCEWPHCRKRQSNA